MRDLSKFVDRKDQLARFEQLLKFEDNCRVLTIQDAPGMGKTYFLEKLRVYCRTLQPRVPVAFIDLQQLDDKSSFSLLQKIRNELSDTGVSFPEFDGFCRGLVSEGQVVNNYSIIVRDNIFENVERLNISSVLGEREIPLDALHTQPIGEKKRKQGEGYERTGEQAFLNDLREYCQEKPIVVLLDHYELCSDEKLKEWLIVYFLEHFFFNISDRPQKILLVITGRKGGLPRFSDNWPGLICEQVISDIGKLGPWPFEELLRFIDLWQASVPQADLEKLHGLMDSGFLTTEKVSAMVEDRANQKLR